MTLARDGVDGRSIYLYGEGWNFGEVADNARGVNAIQRNMAGTGIGTFNDRLRDGARGGGPFSGIQEQGFLTGLWYDPNATDQGSPAEQRARLLQEMDWIRVGLAGNLADYAFVDRFGNTVARAGQIDYNGQPAGYTADPQEAINYVEAHDNDTLFDAIQLKAPVGTTMADRVRMQNLGMSLLAFGQGIPFFHAGVDLLRSKSLDRNSYNSGDWFNRLDFTLQTQQLGRGPAAGAGQPGELADHAAAARPTRRCGPPAPTSATPSRTSGGAGHPAQLAAVPAAHGGRRAAAAPLLQHRARRRSPACSPSASPTTRARWTGSTGGWPCHQRHGREPDPHRRRAGPAAPQAASDPEGLRRPVRAPREVQVVDGHVHGAGANGRRVRRAARA